MGTCRELSTDASLPVAMSDLTLRLARLRVPLGFAGGAVVLWLARPTWASLAAGATLAATGEAIRTWAAGHLEKGREVTKSGPYRFSGHPLYFGSTIIGTGIVVACYSLPVAVITVAYLLVTLGAAIRSEEAGLRAKFGQEYTDYRAGRASDAERRFSATRAIRNREHRAVLGLVVALILLVLKTWLML